MKISTCGKIFTAILASSTIFITGCHYGDALQPEQAITPMLAAGGGTAGWLMSSGMSDDDRALLTGAGAIGGLAVGSFITEQVEDAKRKEFRDGYNLARSNDIKRLYWLQQAQHINTGGDEQVKLYHFPANTEGGSGERYMQHDVVMPVHE